MNVWEITEMLVSVSGLHTDSTFEFTDHESTLTQKNAHMLIEVEFCK